MKEVLFLTGYSKIIHDRDEASIQFPDFPKKTRYQMFSFNCSPAPNGSCSFSAMLQWLARRNKSCSPVAKCWRGSGNFSQTQMDCVTPKDRIDLSPELNETKCDDDDGNDDQVFCRHRHVCLPKRANCTRPEKFNFFSVSQFANRSGMLLYCVIF